jgi:hypothetical protein
VRRFLLVGFVLANLAVSAHGQQFQSVTPNAYIDRWSQQQGVFVSKAVRLTLAQQLLSQGAFTGPAAARDAIASAIATKAPLAIDARSGGSHGWEVVVTNSGRIEYPIVGDGVFRMRAAFSEEKVRVALTQYPRIRVSVEPMPPTDHKIFINNDEADPPHGGTYVVPFGIVNIRVDRVGKLPCAKAVEGALPNPTEVKCIFQ